jgi:hypothetical protein
MPTRCHIPVSLRHVVTVLAAVLSVLQSRKTSVTWPLLTKMLTLHLLSLWVKEIQSLEKCQVVEIPLKGLRT